MGGPKNIEELAGSYFDQHLAPAYRESGTPAGAVASLRKSYVEAILASPEARTELLTALVLDD